MAQVTIEHLSKMQANAIALLFEQEDGDLMKAINKGLNRLKVEPIQQIEMVTYDDDDADDPQHTITVDESATGFEEDEDDDDDFIGDYRNDDDI